MDKPTPRGVRNNNPGNIDRNATKWQGMSADQSSDPRFVVFIAPKYGIRALAKTLITYQEKYGLKTVRQIINRWAPAQENDTAAYIRVVARECRVDPDAIIDLDSSAVMLPLVRAIVRHENGGCPYSDDELMAGLYLAGVHDAPAPRPAFTVAATMPVAVNPNNPPPSVVATAAGAALPINGHAGFLAKLKGLFA